MWRGVCIHLHLPIYMVLIVLLVFVCVRTTEQMGKLINGGSKISLSLSRSFILLFFVLRMFVPIMLLSTRRQSHGLASDRASMCTHIHTMTTLLEIAAYDRLPANSTCNTSTKKQKNRWEKEKNTIKHIYIFVWYCSNFSIKPADTKSFSFSRSVFQYMQLITERSNYEI